VIDLLDTGKDVLLHCVHGRDRTGGVAYVVLRLLANLNDKEVRAKMAELRPSMAIPWKDILPKNKELYDNIARELIHNMIHENKNKNKTERNDI
jgi:protein tyrosine/serine phosphatase|tara:strand:- start:1978 stop:2259 length:282 start_codon:yes stop_codon:yes gene_type:complete